MIFLLAAPLVFLSAETGPWIGSAAAAPVALLSAWVGWRAGAATADVWSQSVALVVVPWVSGWAARRSAQRRAAVARKAWTGLRAVQLGEFLSLVLYQLREYLISVTSIVEGLALSAPKQAPGLSERIDRLQRVVAELNQKAGRLLGDRSSVTTQTVAPNQAFDLARLLRETGEEARLTFGGPSSSLSIVIQGDLPPIRADRRALRACLLAVLQNSFEACAEQAGGASISLVASSDGAVARVEIVDNGGGLRSRAADDLFEPFFCARAATHGLGLGLPISRRLMERMGGSLRLKAGEGGTAALLELPLGRELPFVRNEESTWASRRDQL